MVKKKDSDTDSSSSTDTDNEQKNNIETSTKVKKSGLSKKAKLYIAIAVVLLIGGAYMWYKNKKNNVNELQPNILQGGNQVVQQVIPQNTQAIGQQNPTNVVLSHLTPNPLED